MSYDPGQPLIAIHVPKSGGTSVRQVLEGWFGVNLYRHYYNMPEERLPDRLDLEALTLNGQAPLLYGHFNRLRGFGVDQYYPQVRQFLTILREPLQLHISRYFSSLSRTARNQRVWDSPSADTALEEFVLNGHLNMLEHFPRPVSAENYRDILEEFFLHIGFLEDLEDALATYARVLGFPPDSINVPHLNRAPRTHDVTPELAARFREAHPLEYAVYEAARDMFPPKACLKKARTEKVP